MPTKEHMPTATIAELERLRAALRWIQAESASALRASRDDVPYHFRSAWIYRASLQDINSRARAALAPADPLGTIAEDENVDPEFRAILAGRVA